LVCSIFFCEKVLKKSFQYASYMQAPTSQAVLQHELVGTMQTVPQLNTRNSYGPFFQNDGGAGSIPKQMVILPMSMMMMPKNANPPQQPAVPNQNQRYNPISFGPNLRGVNPFCVFLCGCGSRR
jgi:hypothetical protein